MLLNCPGMRQNLGILHAYSKDCLHLAICLCIPSVRRERPRIGIPCEDVLPPGELILRDIEGLFWLFGVGKDTLIGNFARLVGK